MTTTRYRWTAEGIADLSEYAPRYEERGSPKAGDVVSEKIVEDEARMGFEPSWFLDLGHWSVEKAPGAVDEPLLTEEEMITSAYPPLSPSEVDDFSRIKCSVCGNRINPDDVEEHSKHCVSSGDLSIRPKSASSKSSLALAGMLFGGRSGHGESTSTVAKPNITRTVPPGLEELTKDDPAWSSMVDLLQKASMENITYYRYTLRLKRLWRIRPSRILQQYESEVAATLGKPTQLFYGTSFPEAEKIAQDGFVLPETAGTFGRGVYFASCPLKSASSAPEDSWLPLAKRIVTRPWAALNKENGHILLCDVYLGKYMTVRSKQHDLNPESDLRGGWFRDNLGLGDYDSVYAPGGTWLLNAVSVSEYVIYKVKQGIPRLLLEFDYVY
eukprot:TRINITY_DN99299_c0_g1_i1.p1 TRINITY_DN99299_c0_g1~~TRINITY_DN99299_c0_g1_i1.p1  ORF type:complete len:384 (-),score=53.53 TRINITY_DN99299_c0_g1_i1:47-1198(-)